MAHRGAICNQKGCPTVHWIEENQGPNSKDENVIHYKPSKAIFETDRSIVAYRGNVYNQKGTPGVHWIAERLHAKY